MTISPSIVRLLSALLAIGPMCLCAESPAAPAAGASTLSKPAADTSMPVYHPPKEKAPRARIDGGIRGSDQDLSIVALVPDHVGFTMKKDPTLYWYLSRSSPLPVRFTLMDSAAVDPIVEITLSQPGHAGIQAIRLKDHEIALTPGVQYRWFVTLSVDHDRPSKDLVTGGMIERIEFNEGSVLGFPSTCDEQAVHRYAEAGLWYDAVGCISDLIESNPTDSHLRQQRASLLKQIDLPHVAEFDLRYTSHHGTSR